MTVKCIWEHNGPDTLLWAVNLPGAFTRGEALEIAESKMQTEARSYLCWSGKASEEEISVELTGEKQSSLSIRDADSDVIFTTEKSPLSPPEYKALKALALKSAKDFLALYESVPDKNAALLPKRKTFYGQTPRSATEMYAHTKSVNEYYFTEINISADNDGNIYECRKRGFEALEAKSDFLQNNVSLGSYGEEWSLRKVLRRFIWHDRIHAKALWRTANALLGKEKIPNPFYFE